MKLVLKLSATTTVLIFMLFADIPLVPMELVPEAQAIFGVRRRTAVVAYSAGAAKASSSAAASQQAQVSQQPAQTATPHAVSAVPVGTIVPTLPGGCVAVTVANNQFQDCGGTFYKAAFQGKNLVYVVVDSPL